MTIRSERLGVFVKTATWQEDIKPYIEKQVERFSDIRFLDPKDIENSYLRHKVKVDVYKDILFKIEKEWQEEKDA